MDEARRRRTEGGQLTDVVRASGGLVLRDGNVRVVHRPRYDDWSFPKGKAEAGESDEDCAVREVEEETGLRCSLGRELPSTTYTDPKGRPKVVRYWIMEVVGGELSFEHEVDEAKWVSVDEAASLLSYPRDVDVLLALRSA